MAQKLKRPSHLHLKVFRSSPQPIVLVETQFLTTLCRDEPHLFDQSSKVARVLSEFDDRLEMLRVELARNAAAAADGQSSRCQHCQSKFPTIAEMP
eukprot:4661271-Amphidinium_carterae.2